MLLVNLPRKKFPFVKLLQGDFPSYPRYNVPRGVLFGGILSGETWRGDNLARGNFSRENILRWSSPETAITCYLLFFCMIELYVFIFNYNKYCFFLFFTLLRWIKEYREWIMSTIKTINFEQHRETLRMEYMQDAHLWESMFYPCFYLTT